MGVEHEQESAASKAIDQRHNPVVEPGERVESAKVGDLLGDHPHGLALEYGERQDRVERSTRERGHDVDQRIGGGKSARDAPRAGVDFDTGKPGRGHHPTQREQFLPCRATEGENRGIGG